MHITFDPAKRAWTLEQRDLDFLDAALVFADTTYMVADHRRDYGEERVIAYGYLYGRLVVVGFVQRGESRHVFSMRKANAREEEKIAQLIRLEHGSG
jgi:hypothetical protein